MHRSRKLYLPIVLFFVVSSVLIRVLAAPLRARGIDPDVLTIGNTFVFILTLVTFILHLRAMRSERTANFFQYIYGGFMLKIFLTVALVVGYRLSGGEIGIGVLLLFMGLYLIYSFIETKLVLTATKKRNG